MLLRVVMENMKVLKSLIKWHLRFHKPQTLLSCHTEIKEYTTLHELLVIYLP